MKIERKDIPMLMAVLILAVNVFGLRYPYSVGLFLPLTLILGLLLLVFKQKILFPRTFIPFLGISAYYVVSAFSWRDTSYIVVHRDITNVLSLSLFGYFLFILIRTKEDWHKFYTMSGLALIFVSGLTSIIGLIKFHFLMKNQVLSAFDFVGEDYPWGTSLVTDYNYYALGGLMGLMACILFYRRLHKTYEKVGVVGIGWLNAVSISLCGSRRGLMLLALLLIILAIYLLIRYVSRKICLRTQIIAGSIFLITLLSMVTYNHYAFKTSSQSKANFATKLGYDSVEMPQAFARLAFRYATIIYPDITQAEVYQFYLPQNLWNTEKSKKNLYEKRSEKWIYTVQLFKSYPFVNQLFGHGFSYVPQFADKFTRGVSTEDYPHNYLLSALLYSGVLGLLLILLLILLAIYLYIKTLAEYSLFALLFVISQGFAISSGNSIFSEKFTALLLLLPFLWYQANHVKEKTL